jgi:YbgC/YbaW family acyl-CoA thioester hydrolase
MLFKYTRKIFAYECDIYGHLNNANYLHIFEEARSEALETMNMPVSRFSELGFAIFVTKATIEYKASIESGKIYKVESRMTKINRLRSTWVQKIVDFDGNLCCDFVLEAVFVKGRKPARLTHEQLDLFKPFVSGE